jgi:two-component system phosphate regulon sensor histidine kinase PhoR
MTLGLIVIVSLVLLALRWGAAQWSLTGATIFALLVAVAAGVVAGRAVTQPLVALSNAARAIASGSLPRFPRSEIPEVDSLVQALRQMNRQLAERFEDVQREKAEGTAIVDAMQEGVIATDPRGRIVTANPAARRLLGYGHDAELPDLPTLFRVKAARAVVDDVLSGSAVQDREVEFDGVTLTLNARPLPTGGAVLVLHDLTEVRRLEAVRRDFVANVSHELKTPLTSISGYAETLAEGGVDADTTRRFLGTIVTNARRMQRLVDDLLDLSRIEAGRWIPAAEPIEVGNVAAECWTLFRERASARHVEFRREIADDATRIDVDPDAIRHILQNLMDNALRYVPEHGTITCRSVRAEGGIVLSIEDNGTGIAGDHLPRIFERFYRVDASRSRDEGGTGLGLAIVKHMVEAHGGRVWAESARGEGTAVRSWWPDASREA